MKIELTPKEMNSIVKRASSRFIKEYKSNHKKVDQDSLDDALNFTLQNILWKSLSDEIFNSRAVDDEIMEMAQRCADNIEKHFGLVSSDDEDDDANSWRSNNTLY